MLQSAYVKEGFSLDNCEKNIDNQEIEVANATASEQEVPENEKKKLPSKWLVFGGVTVAIIVAIVLYFNSSFYNYCCAEDLLTEGKYEEAATIFADLGDYKDSKQKISECNRRILYAFLQDGDYTLNATQYSYTLGTEDGKIAVSVSFSDQNAKFRLLLDMASDKGEFVCEYAPLPLLATTSDGAFKISDLKKSENNLEIVNVSGYYDASQMKSLADIACNVLCMNLDTALKNSGLGITSADLGFSL